MAIVLGDEQAVMNTDREIYTTHDERGDYYGDKIFVTASGGIGFNVGRNCIGIELNPEYAAMAERRIRSDAGMFADVEAHPM